jgi:hypothetical protein
MFVLSNPCVTSGSSSLMIFESVGVLGMSNPCVNHESSFVDDF